MPGIFDNKIFNTEVFNKYTQRIPNLRKNELLKSRALVTRNDLKAAMTDQVGGNYIVTPLKGLISGSTPSNYDGQTDIESQSTETYMHSRVVVGRSKAWTEKDFSYDITGGVDFMENIAAQVVDYWDEIDQDTILAILKGIFSMTGIGNKPFVDNHTADITKELEANTMGATTLNTAMQRALGDNKSKFSLAIMHSAVSTNLENLNLLSYLKYTDKNGVQRDLRLATLNGRLVVIDDSMPTEEVAAQYIKVDSTVEGALKVVASSATGAQINKADVTPTVPGYTAANDDYVVKLPAYTAYTTYVLGEGAIEYTDAGVKVPSETDRNPAKNGGEDTLYTRQRKCFAPYGINFTKSSMDTASPTDEELKKGANWELVNTTVNSSKKYINHRAIPIARIISRG